MTYQIKSDRHYLETTFHDNGSSVTNTTYRTDLSSRQRRVPINTRWNNKRELGRGAYGTVILQESTDGHLRAVKRILDPRSSVREIKALSKVSDRKDLFVSFLGWYEDANFLYIVMEFIEYGDLGVYIRNQNGPLPETTSREITKQVLEGLVVLHERRICHRDLKPQNILIASANPIWVKISDFGSSKYLKNTCFKTKVGTEGYFAPELLGMWEPARQDRQDLTYAVDMWSLGCIVYETLASVGPFTFDTQISVPEVAETDMSGIVTNDLRSEVNMRLLFTFCCGQMTLPVDRLRSRSASESSIDFVKALLHADPSLRLSAQESLKAPWISGEANTTDLDTIQHSDTPIERREFFSPASTVDSWDIPTSPRTTNDSYNNSPGAEESSPVTAILSEDIPVSKPPPTTDDSPSPVTAVISKDMPVPKSSPAADDDDSYSFPKRSWPPPPPPAILRFPEPTSTPKTTGRYDDFSPAADDRPPRVPFPRTRGGDEASFDLMPDRLNSESSSLCSQSSLSVHDLVSGLRPKRPSLLIEIDDPHSPSPLKPKNSYGRPSSPVSPLEPPFGDDPLDNADDQTPPSPVSPLDKWPPSPVSPLPPASSDASFDADHQRPPSPVSPLSITSFAEFFEEKDDKIPLPHAQPPTPPPRRSRPLYLPSSDNHTSPPLPRPPTFSTFSFLDTDYETPPRSSSPAVSLPGITVVRTGPETPKNKSRFVRWLKDQLN